jgi:hypothetical protein
MSSLLSVLGTLLIACVVSVLFVVMLALWATPMNLVSGMFGVTFIAITALCGDYV